MSERYIPHEETCPICGKVTGCEDKYCKKPSNAVCDDPICQQVAAAGTVHQKASSAGILPCCGKHVTETPRGDRMVIDPSKVTCQGAAKPAEVSQ